MSLRIFLEDYMPEGERYWVGELSGEILRASARLAETDALYEAVELVVSERVVLVTTAFLQGLLGPSVRALGADTFKQRYILPTQIRPVQLAHLLTLVAPGE